MWSVGLIANSKFGGHPMEIEHSGGCLCGAVRFTIEGKPVTTVVCHCTFCQKRTGSTNAFLIYFNKNAVVSLGGPLEKFVHVSDESGRKIEIEFCQTCGSHVTWTLDLVPSWRGFEGGSFDDNSGFSRKIHMWTDSSHPSEKFSDDQICFHKQPPFNTEKLEEL